MNTSRQRIVLIALIVLAALLVAGADLFWFHHTSNIVSGDDHTQYALLAGRSGGQVLIGGTSSSDELRLAGVVGAGTSYMAVQSDGFVVWTGVVAWQDLRVPLDSVKLGGVKDPTFGQWKNDGSGSRGVYAWSFADQAVAGNEEELFFSAQIPHGYKEGEDIEFHVHWTPAVTGGANEFVQWGLEYAWQDIDETFATDTTIIASDASSAATATSSGDTTLVAGKHYKTVFSDISGSGLKISSMLICRFFRNSSDSDDDLAQAAIAFEVDFHFPIDAIGSRDHDTK